ncbi:carbon-nitrogen hydrolase [Entophlyctis helioformis]|nr:carbon-nitrogen hydrolase [Entophlyctis helioformis]
MKVVCMQFAPVLGSVDANIAKANELLTLLEADNVDILVLPEMAFSGYAFKSREDVLPFAEEGQSGPSVRWAKEQALRLKAHVQVGYPRRQADASTGEIKLYNSVCLIGPDGRLLVTYDKHFLYEVDETWATAGPGFRSVAIPALGGKVGFGICMDLNPHKFEAPFEAYEFANYHLTAASRLLLCSMAWLKPTDQPEEGDEDDGDEDPETKTSMQMANYWLQRLYPMMTDIVGGSDETRQAIVVICNRTGSEGDTHYGGSSCVLGIHAEGISLYGQLSPSDEALLCTSVPE